MLIIKRHTVSETDPQIWDQLVQDLGGSVFHSFAWNRLSERSRNNVRSYFLSILDQEGNIVGLTAAQLVQGNKPFIDPLRARIETDTWPLSTNSQTTLEMVPNILESFRNQVVASQISIGSFAQSNFDSSPKKTTIRKERIEFVINLNKDLSEINSKFSERRKRGLKKTKALVMTQPTFEKGFTTCLELQGRSAERIIQRGGPNTATLVEEDRLPFSEFFKSSYPHFLAATDEDKVVGIVLISIFGEKCYYHRAYHSDEGFKLNSPVFLISKCIEFAKQRGATTFNIGGVAASAENEADPEHGLFQFKNSFGAKQQKCTNLILKNDKFFQHCLGYFSNLITRGS